MDRPPNPSGAAAPQAGAEESKTTDESTTAAGGVSKEQSSLPLARRSPSYAPERGDPPRRAATADEVKKALEALSERVKVGATDPTTPWAMAHGLTAFGRTLQASDGRLVIDAIVKDHLARKTFGDRKVHVFPTRTAAGEPVEPHPFLIAKSLAEAGVPLNQTLRFSGGKITMATLLADTEWLFALPSTDKGWHQVAWAISLFMALPPEDGTIDTQNGPLALRRIAEASLARLETEQEFLQQLLRRGRPDLVQKRRQGIFGHTCGGLHFVQAAVRAAAPFDHLVPRARAQLDVVRFRWAAERRIYRRMVNLKPRYRAVLLVQELKFYGHVLETMALAVRWGVLKADAALKRDMHLVAGDLVDTIEALAPFYGNLPRVRNNSAQTYYDLIGDGCHAVRGLRESLVAFY